MFIAVCYSLYAFQRVMRFSKFKWVQKMIGLCVLSNFTTIYFLIVDRLEKTAWAKAHPLIEEINMMISIFTWYGLQNVIYWLFGFKYWIIALEIPALLNEDANGKPKKRFWTEKRYNLALYIGLFIQIADTALEGWARGRANWYVDTAPSVPPEVADNLANAYHSQELLLLLSGCFLMDAIRRFNNQFKKDKRLQVNTKVMRLHVSALLIHTIFMAYF